MSQLPTLDTPLISGVRRVVTNGARLSTGLSATLATIVFPARSVLRSVFFAIDGTLEAADDVHLDLFSGNAAPPVDSDFTGTGRILPNASIAGAVADYPADPLSSARDIPYNFLLPDHSSRILMRITNNAAVTIEYRIRLVIDGLGELGF